MPKKEQTDAGNDAKRPNTQGVRTDKQASVLITQQPAVKKKRLGIASDLFSYIRHTGKWWMLPAIIMLLLAGVIIIAGGTTLSPFIYALI